jgi:hypothetical protein
MFFSDLDTPFPTLCVCVPQSMAARHQRLSSQRGAESTRQRSTQQDQCREKQVQTVQS